MSNFKKLEDELDGDEVVDEGRVISFTAEMLRESINAGASAVHIVHLPEESIVQFRVNGTLHEWQRFPRSMRPAVAARIKILARLDIAQLHVPQNGRFRWTDPEAKFMVSLLPAAHGEDIFLRRLDTSTPERDLHDCGFEADLLNVVERAATAPSGLVVIAGPSGSGRTTTRYAMLARAFAAGRAVMTAEEWVPKLLPGATQILVRQRDLRMDTALAAIDRSDPDVVMASHVRDHVAAERCVEMAISGRLVICSMYVGSAREAHARLCDMGIESYRLAMALRAIVAQRLLRRLCRKCKEPESLVPEVASRFGIPEKVFRANGCDACRGTGYEGRVLVAEGVEVDALARTQIARGELPSARRTLPEDALAKVTAGVTSLAEVTAATFE